MAVNEVSAEEAPVAAVRPKMRIRELLKVLEEKDFTLPHTASASDCIAHLIDDKLNSALVVTPDGAVLGIITARDLLKFVSDHNENKPSRGLEEQLRTTKVTDIMTRREKIIYCSPDDTTRRCREIMFQCRIGNMPILDKGEVRGLLTMQALADASFNLLDTGGKKGFIHNVTGRRGLPETARVALRASPCGGGAGGGGVGGDSTGPCAKLDAEVAAFALPHPFKTSDGVAMDRYHYGAGPLAEDLSLCEDAHFALRIAEPSSSSSIASVEFGGNVPAEAATAPRLLPLSASSEPNSLYLCVADGVGSWRQYNVDPRLYSHRLVEHARKVIESDYVHRALIRHSPFESDLDPIHPLDVILDAWNLTTSEEVPGSSTICVATLDKKLNQLSYSNVGDCGLMVVRHIDSETAGYMRERALPRHLRKTDLRIAYLSQQQLRSFNLPYQLGFSNVPEVSNTHFESPSDADTASIPVMPGDIIVLATDGLFDNVDLDEIVEIISDWEREYFANPDQILSKPSSRGNEAVQALAEQLVRKAREVSLDAERDSPFAVLAKENDIMWGGGMPDDTTVIVARIVSIA